MGVSKSSKALDDLLNSERAQDKRIAARIFEQVGERKDGKKVHRTVLWKLRNGKRKPGLELAAWLESVTNRRVAVSGWSEEHDHSSPAPQPSATQ